MCRRAPCYHESMAADGSRGPRPYRQRQASTLFLRVPKAEWPEVTLGVKREFRAGSGKVSALFNVEPPVPVVAYTVDTFGRYKNALMVLEAVWREPLGAITKESLEAEGFTTFEEFFDHWIAREHRPFPTLAMTTVYRVRPWGLEDYRGMADELLRHLYGEFLNPSAQMPA